MLTKTIGKTTASNTHITFLYISVSYFMDMVHFI